ncbi:hypothetical protein BDF22DRAFT_702517 [Syncephalis plumigaleata]|nr:hypothetical protein BDF22DRAFT_702517 [Syncephalis plumigaleata]
MSNNENLARLTVRIRSPVIELPDNFQVSVLREGSIWNLKQVLASSAHVEPLQPADLHLIYHGRILNDEQPLAATFKDAAIVPTIHMVSKRPVKKNDTAAHCRPSATALGKKPCIDESIDCTTTTATTTATATATNIDSSAVANTAQYTYHVVTISGVRYLLQLPKNAATTLRSPLDTTALAQTMIMGDSLDNYLAINRQSAVSTSTPSSSPSPLSNSMSSTDYQRVENELEAEAEVRRRAREQEQLQREQEAEERVQNERVAHFWLLAKLAFFSYLFSQNASIGQMFMVHFVALIIFLSQTNRLAFLRDWWSHRHQLAWPWRGANQAQANANAVPQPMAGNDEAAPLNQQQQHGAHYTHSDAPRNAPALPVSRWGQVERALTAFVTSLVPTEPDGIDPLGMDQEGEMANEMF